ncbi:CYFA0S01e06700g1_1 [Cyberlindnera fabianii]|uniref:Alkyl transferase n=1 Tax=Cyberlindnera fabianii TaxID=36022 RepID=A0A061ANX6_CYBFA|nr:Dehydrodolichyl diphosphate syntase complex subunit SRT1 [Cyberlindnera fabianii]CDR37040.1 CYFA0S01e06700g1_1 [Cyberlindnera fabianii]
MGILNGLYNYVGTHLTGPIFETVDEHARDVIISTLRTGNVPQHVAFIMDGNRRYAKSKGLQTHKGHEMGAVALIQIIDSCLKLGISHVSMYAFSIENFKRTPEEVSLLFSLLMERIDQFLNQSERYSQGARVRIIGNRTLVPEETMEKLEEIEKKTFNNNKITLNVCFSYTSRDELTHSIGQSVLLAEGGYSNKNKVDEEWVERFFYYPTDTPKVDLLVRTSGHTRLSDYLLWQVCENAKIVFVSTYWPQFSVFEFYLVLIQWGFEKSIAEKFKDYESYLISKFEGVVPTSYKKKGGVNLNELPIPPPFVTVTGKLTSSSK